MDPVTHGLASYALTRAAFPRARPATMIAAIVAGVSADLDALSASFGPASFLTWHRTYTHSFAGALGIAALVSAIAWLAQRVRVAKNSAGIIFAAAFGASLLHVAIDLCQNDGAEVLWPFSSQRYSACWLPPFDLWILLILLAGVLLPQLLALVTEEIGAKSKAPRGRVGAWIVLALAGLYTGGRAVLNSNAVAMLDSRTYRGESLKRAAAFAESDSPLHWHGVVETERALYDLQLDLGRRASFNPDIAMVSYKPGDTPALAAARNTAVVRRFLQAAKFPRASVEQTKTGFRVEIRDFALQQEASSARRVAALVETDPNAKVTNEELVWDESRGREF